MNIEIPPIFVASRFKNEKSQSAVRSDSPGFSKGSANACDLNAFEKSKVIIYLIIISNKKLTLNVSLDFPL
jgi:hypothetical protein